MCQNTSRHNRTEESYKVIPFVQLPKPQTLCRRQPIRLTSYPPLAFPTHRTLHRHCQQQHNIQPPSASLHTVHHRRLCQLQPASPSALKTHVVIFCAPPPSALFALIASRIQAASVISLPNHRHFNNNIQSCTLNQSPSPTFAPSKTNPKSTPFLPK